MSSFQVTVKATVPDEIQNDKVISRYTPIRVSGIVIDPKNKLTQEGAGKFAAEYVLQNFINRYPNVAVSVVKVVKLKEDFICNTSIQ